MKQTVIKNDKRTIRAWAFFDWANSVYALVISTAVFPIYYTTVSSETIDLMGKSYQSSSLYSFTVSASYIIIAAVSPLLSGIADHAGRRLLFLKIFTAFGALACTLLYTFADSTDIWFGLLFFGLATIGFAGSLVFYDSFLPIIATEDQYDKISATGYSYGYVGSVILLLFILFMVQKPETFGFAPDSTLPSRVGFVLVGLWWLGFAQYTFRNMPKDQPTEDAHKFSLLNKGVISEGYLEVKKVFWEAMASTNMKKYLISFFFAMAGVQTVVYLATVFAKKELGMETSELILTILLIQLVGIVGALLFSRVSRHIGNRNSMMIQIFIWFLICLAAYFCQNKYQFFGIAAVVGMVMGGIQALARASYSKLIPETTQDYTSYFSLYDVTYKLSIVFGTFSYGLVELMTNSMRYSALALATYFFLSFVFMYMVVFPKRLKKF
jgi:MFS transporter, UMF1 family